MSPLVSIDQARRTVLEACRALAPVEVPFERALGLVLAVPVVSQEAVPPFANSSMDGYAVRSVDVAGAPVELRVVGQLMAGDDPSAVAVGPREAVRIMTGAVVPAGADAVCMVEHTSLRGDAVMVHDRLASGTNVRAPGDDIGAGDEVFPAGERLGAAHIGVLASVGAGRVRVHPRPRVGVASTGDELVSGGASWGPGQIRDSNRPGLLAQLEVDGFEPVDLGWVPDEPGTLAEALLGAAARCDAVLTSGGVSVGDRDVVKLVLGQLGGAAARSVQVAVKPAKPFSFSPLPPAGMPVFGLPGNPVSAMVSYELFARPALRLMAGHRRLYRPVVACRAETDLQRRPDGRLHLVRAVLSCGPRGDLRARPTAGQGSHQLRSLAAANALVALPDGDGARAGDLVQAWLLDAEPLAGTDLPGPGPLAPS